MSSAGSAERRFVLLRHTTAAGVHWDLMIELAGTLATWRLERLPDAEAREPIQAERIGDHRLAYMEYEGPISGDRGVVVREDRGTANVLRRDASVWEVKFSGARLCGRYRLETDGDQDWRLSRV